ncbi:MAG TPA: C25 family cysteine peptidase, partial [Candidatus Fermentibacter sp.]|nr:C25 family cysteine peptidase [Candidatus Fermentibacter sp.]
LYIHPAGYLDDVETLLDPAASNATVSLEEIYDEFDGGVRDPYAVVAFLDYVLDNWDPVPVDVILCGSGHFDPRNRISSRISLIDALHSPGDFFQDDIYAMTEGADLPQFAVSRICTSERSGFAAIASRSQSYRSGEYGGTWQTRVIGAADDERSSKSSFDEPYHTDSMEYILEHSLPAAFRPVKHYLIFYPFDDLWKKPAARADFIELWSEGALMVSFLGHGSFDQLADEGLFYMEDVGLLENSDRLPVAFFGSCRVGQFQDPAWDCLAQSVTTAPLGGAIAGIGATFDTAGTLNEALLAAFTEAVLSGGGASMASCLLAAKLSAGYSGLNNRVYVMFGDGSTPPALPGALPQPYSDTLRTGEPASVSGECPGTGPVLVEAFESARRQTYYTFRQGLPIDYMDMGARFFSGSAAAGPGYSAPMFVPADADTGSAG